MRIDGAEVRRRCRARGLSLSRALGEAGVSRTAYYSLTRRDSVLPKSILRLAEALSTNPSQLLDESGIVERRARARLVEAKRIVAKHRGASFENIWHSLTLLDELPVERLNRALRRGRTGSLSR